MSWTKPSISPSVDLPFRCQIGWHRWVEQATGTRRACCRCGLTESRAASLVKVDRWVFWGYQHPDDIGRPGMLVDDPVPGKDRPKK